MAAQQASSAAMGDDGGYRSEDEDSTVGLGADQIPDVEDPVIRIQQNSSLRQDDWTPRNYEDQRNWRYYIPYWTRPGYDDNVEVSHDGTRQRPRRGDFWSMMRPALLPTDPRPTQYAGRFGIFPDRKFNENSEARSMLTPDFDTQWGFEKSFQSTVFQSFTTQELSDSGALNPTQALPRPDLQGEIWHLFARERWPTLGIPFWYNFTGQDKLWDVQQNDELWGALQPALQFASRVLQNDHPFWKAMLSLYHLRPVPAEKDGRTAEEKSQPGYKPYVSVWYDIDRSKMYPSARALMGQNFDSTAATLEILRLLLRFSIVHTAGTASATTRPVIPPDDKAQAYRIRIEINAAYIWPLLAPQFSVSEKTAVSFFLGKLILHELAHAAKCAQQILLNRPWLLTGMLTNEPWIPPPNTNFNYSIITDLNNFRQEAFTNTATSMEYVFQDVPQMEEGKCFEQQLFGFELSAGPQPAPGRQNDAYRPLVTAVSWPWKHPMVHLQNQQAVDAGLYRNYTSHGYRTYLLDPPASAYDLMTPLPVSSFAKFMQQSWWDSDFAKFGHQGLKIPIHSTDPSSSIKSVAVPNEILASQFLPMLSVVLRSQAALQFIDYAIPVLREHKQIAILTYLMLLTREAASASLMRNRLHYEKRTWPNRLRGIEDLSRISTQNFNTAWHSLNHTLQSWLSQNTLVDLQQVVTNTRTMLVNLMELDRLLGVEVQYSQAVAAQYILKTPEERRKIHRRYMSVLRLNLVGMTEAVTDALNKIGRDHQDQGGFQWETVMAPWEARLEFMIATNSGHLAWAASQQIHAATETLTHLRKEAQQKCMDLAQTMGHMDSVARILGDGYIDFPVADATRGLFPGVPIARSMMTLSKSVEAAAVQQITFMRNRGIDDIVRQWVALLEAHVGLSDRMRGIRQQVAVTRTRASINAAKTVLFQVKRGDLQPVAQQGQPAVQGGQLARDQRLANIRASIRNLVQDKDDLITFLQDLCRHEQDEEEFRTIMRIPYPQPPQQQNM